jgi:hypothetical protein
MKKTVAEVSVRPNMVYDATIYYDDNGNKSAIYKEVMPEWGTVEFNGDHLKTTLRYLTAGLQVPLLQYAGNATAIKIQVLDPATNTYLDIAGTFEAVLSEGKNKMIVNTNAAAQFLTQPDATYFSTTSGAAPNPAPSKAIYVDIIHASHDLASLTADEKARAVLWVPLPDTDGKPVIIEISATNDPINVEFGYKNPELNADPDRNRVVNNSDMWEKNYKPIWKSAEPKALVANMFYGPKNFYNFTVGGIDTNAINEALEDATPVNKEVILTTEDVITVCGTDNTIIIPTERNADTDYIKIDMSKGLIGCKDGETLKVVYEDPDQPFPGEVEIIGANVSRPAQPDYRVKLDADVPATTFAIAGDAFDHWKTASLDIDAKAFSLGNDDLKTAYKGANLKLSDNVEELVIAKNAVLESLASTSPYDAVVVGNTSKMEKFTVNGVVNNVEFDAHDAGEELDVLVSGEPALYIGQIRTTGSLTAEKSAIILADQGDAHGVAAIKDVIVTDKAFINGSIFSDEGDINIHNVNGDNSFGAGNGNLGDVIYQRLGIDLDPSLRSLLNAAKPYEYGPLYSEGVNNGTGRVLVNAENTAITLVPGLYQNGNTVPTAVIEKLNQHATDAVKYSVYARTDIQLSGDITAQPDTKMWAENDIKFSGKVIANNQNQMDADHDFIIEGESKADKVNVGRKADVKVDDQNGACDAIDVLTFKQNPTEKNMLDLTQGYIRFLYNYDPATHQPIDVELRFDDVNGAYAAIGKVDEPDHLFPMNESKWNGKQIPESLKPTFVQTDQPNIWTATQLAAQTTTSGTTTSEPFLRSDIDLMGYDWDGIRATATAYEFEGNNKYVENFNIVSKDNRVAGFIAEAAAGVPATISNLTLNNVGSNIAAVPAKGVGYGTGALIGRANDALTVNRVKVKLAQGNFGSDGTKNIKTANVGGLGGVAAKDVVINGVEVDASQATLTGWYNLGGMFGRTAGNVTITDAPDDDINNLAALQTKVIAPAAFQVTFLDTNPPLDRIDLNQGKTGLYIGSAVLSNNIDIQATGNQYNDAITVTGVAEESAAWEHGNAIYGASTIEGKWIFGRKDANGKFIQTMIGQSGITETEFNAQKLVKIGALYFRFFRGSNIGGADLTGPLYNVTFIQD